VTVTNPMNTANGAAYGRTSSRCSRRSPTQPPSTSTASRSPDRAVRERHGRAARRRRAFHAAAPLAFDTDYTARLTAAIKDKAGNHLAADYVWRFNTGKKIVAGFDHTCARFDDGRVKCWGANPFGQLGLGDSTPRGVLLKTWGMTCRL